MNLKPVYVLSLKPYIFMYVDVYIPNIYVYVYVCTLYSYMVLILYGFIHRNTMCYHTQQLGTNIGENEETTSESLTVNETILLGDCVEVTNEPYKGFCAIVIGSSYGDELELPCFEQKQGLPSGIYWVLKENDLDKCDLKKRSCYVLTIKTDVFRNC